MKLTIKDSERGFLYKDGRFLRLLEPGKHNVRAYFGYSAEVREIDDTPFCDERLIATFGNDESFAASVTSVDVADGEVALHYVDGRYADVLPAGRYAFWNVFKRHTFKVVNTFEQTEEGAVRGIPAYILEQLPENICKSVDVDEGQAVLLYIDGAFVRRLPVGRHFFWQNGRTVSWEIYDMRSLQMEVQGQEILTLDKVGVRVNFVCTFRIVDPVKMHAEIRDYWAQIYVAMQLALREFIGRMKFDDLLEQKDSIADRVLGILKSRQDSLYVEFLTAGMKDIILPGEIRDIMNTVLIAEKRAQANVITRREEVASTRSLLNTARLMDENVTLYKLKKLEYLEKICEQVGSISLNSASGLLEQLADVMKV